ncbi:hypothetical protein N0V83_003325 [Neocucurbitaria cava]|uniref:HMG box domain-containing protein n=1 Tax=Neocucurbitaria cava TaxID=798079 RepID=A0A9W9CNE3_9PLEO|nr:hypothetical protein N0V83_003325 [Neocucurbitaria cava]
MPDLSAILERLGLTTYLQVLRENGFHNWETVVDITEEDFATLNVKLGHRRALQREIASFRGVPPLLSLESESVSPEPASLSTLALETLTRQTSTPPPREKRRYRRHPRPDINAPKKPKTAYVNFADRIRTDSEISQLSFVKIAREVGRRWQELPAEQKRIWESSAARAMQEFEAQMDEYRKTDSWRRYQVYLRDFKMQQSMSTTGKRPGNSRATTDTSNNTRPYSATSPSSSDSPISPAFNASNEIGAEQCHNALTLAFSELVTLRGEILNQETRPYDEQHLPSEEVVRRSMYAFIRGTGSLLFMWTYEQADEILNRIYRPQERVDPMTLAECFTVAAMGAHYDMDCFSDQIRRVLYASGTLHFHEHTAGQDYLRTMRLLLSMSFYALLEKHMSARYLIAAGLQIARWKYPALHSSNEGGPNDNRKKILRSLIFMDCWLSYTLGYTSEATPSDILVATSLDSRDCLSVDQLIHMQTSKIGLIAAEITTTLASPKLVTKENISLLNQKLESWRVEVPDALQIPALTSSTPTHLTLYQRRAILMVHIMYLGALVLLYRQLLVAIAETQLADGSAYNPNFSTTDARRYRNDCAVAAQQIARILGLIDFDGTLTKRCWLIIYWAFSAAVVLLSSATTKLADGHTDGVDADLKYAKACMDKLEPSRQFEPIAARYLDTLWPLYDSLRDVLQRWVGRSKTSIFALIQADPSTMSPPIAVSKQEMGPISTKLTLLLTDPFGRKQGLPGDGSTRRLLNADGSCSVFWWK